MRKCYAQYAQHCELIQFGYLYDFNSGHNILYTVRRLLSNTNMIKTEITTKIFPVFNWWKNPVKLFGNNKVYTYQILQQLQQYDTDTV